MPGTVINAQMSPELARDPAVQRWTERFPAKPCRPVRFECAPARLARAFPPRSPAVTTIAWRLPRRPLGWAAASSRPRFLIPFALAADVRCVGSDNGTQEPFIVLHHCADAAAEKPCRLLSDAEMPPKRNAGKPLTGYREQMQRCEPRPHRQVCAFEGRSESCGELGIAGFALAIVLAPASHRRPDITALGAYRAVGPAYLFEVSPARIIVWKFVEKSHYRHEPHMGTLTTKANRPVQAAPTSPQFARSFRAQGRPCGIRRNGRPHRSGRAGVEASRTGTGN